MVRLVRIATSRICTRGPRCICQGRAGSVWIRPRVYSLGKGTCRWQLRRSRRPPRRFRATWIPARSVSRTKCRFGECWKTRASRCRTPRSSGSAFFLWVARWIGEIQAGDIRLTMGGEPTFVSIDDMDGAEWNIAALGPREADSRGKVAGAATRALCSRRIAALRTRQMVSGRAFAALVFRLLLADGWYAAVAGS